MKKARKRLAWPLKILAMVFFATGLCATVWAQEDQEAKVAKKDVPTAVLTAFAKAFPKATVKGYAREVEKGQTMYEVECVEGKTHRDVSFAPDGKLLLVEEEVEMNEVPEAVQQALEKKFPKAKVNIAEKIMDGKSGAYEFHLTTAAGKKAEVKFDAQGGEEKPSDTREQTLMQQQLMRENVRSFLSVWLIEGATDKAALFFGNAAFQNEVILAASCASYIAPEERSSQKARRAGVNKFLRDFVPTEQKKDLAEVLNREAIGPLVNQMGSKVINDPEVDLCVVAKLAREEIPTEESKEADYLPQHLPARLYASFVPIGQGMVYFLWVPEGETWKICHASLVCV